MLDPQTLELQQACEQEHEANLKLCGRIQDLERLLRDYEAFGENGYGTTEADWVARRDNLQQRAKELLD